LLRTAFGRHRAFFDLLTAAPGARHTMGTDGREVAKDHRGLLGIGGRQHYTGAVTQVVQIQPTRSVVLAQQHD
jgi:hypothetical protein